MNLDIAGRIALVTGADSGIGRETARQLLAEGARVAISDRAGGDLDAALAGMQSLGEVIAVPADVTSTDSVRALFREVRDQLGPPEILVHCAGIQGVTGDFLSIDDDGWLRTIDTDLMGAVRTAREAIPAMREQHWGRIVLIGSEDAVQPYVEELPYCAAKAGILNLAKGLSKAYGPDNVLVNAVSPAFIATPMTDTMMRKRASQKDTSVDGAIDSFLTEERPDMVLKRRGHAEEVAATIVFLCSERASFINGANVRVDSGSVKTV